MRVNTELLAAGILGSPEGAAEIMKIKLLGGKLLGCECGYFCVIPPETMLDHRAKLLPGDQLTINCANCSRPLLTEVSG